MASQQRIDDTLRLMRKPLGTKVDAELGAEICRRDGGIRALLTGSIVKVGSTYQLGVTMVDPFREVALSSTTERAQGADQVLDAMQELSHWVRENLGETLASIQISSEKLEKATTPSCRTL